MYATNCSLQDQADPLSGSKTRLKSWLFGFDSTKITPSSEKLSKNPFSKIRCMKHHGRAQGKYNLIHKWEETVDSAGPIWSAVARASTIPRINLKIWCLHPLAVNLICQPSVKGELRPEKTELIIALTRRVRRWKQRENPFPGYIFKEIACVFWCLIHKRKVSSLGRKLQ